MKQVGRGVERRKDWVDKKKITQQLVKRKGLLQSTNNFTTINHHVERKRAATYPPGYLSVISFAPLKDGLDIYPSLLLHLCFSSS